MLKEKFRRLTLDRTGRILTTGSLSLIDKAFSILGIFYTLPLVIGHYGKESFGLWSTLSILFVFLKIADGGASQALVVYAARLSGEGRPQDIPAYVAASYTVCFFVGMLLFAISLATLGIGISEIISVKNSELASQAKIIVFIIINSLAIGFPAAVVRSLRLGLQQGSNVSLWGICSTIAGIIGQIIVIKLNYSIVFFATVFSFTPIIFNIIMTILFFFQRGKIFRPNFSKCTVDICLKLLANGIFFVVLMVSYALSNQLDQVWISKISGLESVAPYAIAQKIFTQPQMVALLFFGAQMPAYAEALSNGTFSWIRKQFFYSFVMTLVISTTLCLILVASFDFIVDIWLKKALLFSSDLIWSMALYGVVLSVSNLLLYANYGLGLYRRLIVMQVAIVFVNNGLSIYFIEKLGPSGACLGIAMGTLLCFIVPSLALLLRDMKDLEQLRRKVASRPAMVSDEPEVLPNMTR